jgi:chromate transporter
LPDRPPNGSALVDVRSDEDFSTDPTFIPGAMRLGCASVAQWTDIFQALSAIEVGQKGAKCTHGVGALLRQAGAHALKLEGGHEAWAKAGPPVIPEAKLPPRDALHHRRSAATDEPHNSSTIKFEAKQEAMNDMSTNARSADTAHDVSIGEAFRVWLRIALLSFGGPAGQIAVMHRILVDEKKWVSENRFLHALNYCMLLPGPEAQQLATYIGWLMHKTRGGIIAGGLFVLPGAIAIMALSLIYSAFGNVGLVAALFFGLKAAVLAIVVQAVSGVGKRALKNNIMRGLAATAFVAIFFLDVPFPIIILTAGIIGYFGGRAGHPAFAVGGRHGAKSANESPDSLLGDELPDHAKISIGHSLKVASIWLVVWLTPVAALLFFLGDSNVFSQIAVFFSKMAVVTFGGAYAVLAYVAQQAVENFHWLRPGEMLDGLGMAETTPGPLIMVLQFVGFMAAYRDPGALRPLLAGALGGLLTTWVTFTPCFLWIFLGAPYIEQLRGNKALTGALSAITAAVVGVILNLAIWFAIHTIFHQTITVRGLGFVFDLPVPASVEVWALLLSIGAVFAIFRFKAGLLQTLGACAAAGVLLFLVGTITPGNAATPNRAQTMAPRSARLADAGSHRAVSVNMSIVIMKD